MEARTRGRMSKAPGERRRPYDGAQTLLQTVARAGASPVARESFAARGRLTLR